MKKIISAGLISTMLIVPCANYSSANFSLSGKIVNSSLAEKVQEHPFIVSAAGIFVTLHLADKAFSAVKERIDTNLGYRIPKYKGGYTHKEGKSSNDYSFPETDYNTNKNIYESPKFKSIPYSDKDCNVYYSTTGKFQLDVNEEQKQNFSERGYVSVKLRETPLEEIGKFKKPFMWAYGKLTGKKPNKYNEFYIHGPNLSKPTFVNYFKQFIPFVHSPKVSFLSCLKNVLPWNEKDFVKINYGIVLTSKDDEAALNFKAPTTADYTKEYLNQKKVNEEREKRQKSNSEKEFETYEYDYIEDITRSKAGKTEHLVKKKKVNPSNTIQKYYTEEAIKKLKDENGKKKNAVLERLANACQDKYVTKGEIARLSLQNPEQTFRLVINNANGTWDADKLSALFSLAAEKRIKVDSHSDLLFDFEYVLPLPPKLQNESEAKQSSATKIIKEVSSIEFPDILPKLDKGKSDPNTPDGANPDDGKKDTKNTGGANSNDDKKDTKKSNGFNPGNDKKDTKNTGGANPNDDKQDPKKPGTSTTIKINTHDKDKSKTDKKQNNQTKSKNKNRSKK